MQRDKTPYKDAAARLKARRLARGISVPVMAERLGVSLPRYRTWEKLFGPLPQRQYGAAIDRILEDDLPTESCPPVEEQDLAQAPEYHGFGERARKRREQLGMSRGFVAEKIGLKPMSLMQWERSLPRRHRGEIEDAWEDAIEVPRGWLRNPILEFPPIKRRTLADVGCQTVEDEIRAVAAWLSRPQPTKRTWHFDSLTEAEQRRATMFAERYGASAEDGTSLQAIGDRYSLTRERVRQVVEVMADRARGVQFDLVQLVRVKEAASMHVMWRVMDFEEAHRDLLGHVSLPDADRFAREILGFGITSLSDRMFVQNANPLCQVIIDPVIQELAVAVRAAAMKMNRSSGAAHIMYVSGLASEALGRAVSLSEVRVALTVIEGMQWLTPDEDWFWLGPDAANNRILDCVRKVLAVASRRVDVEALHQAVCRNRRPYYKTDKRSQPTEIEVTQEVLREILSRVPWLSVIQKNDFVLTEPVAIEDVLNSSELAVVRVIEEHRGAATWGEFNKRFVMAGVFTAINLNLVLSHSPVIRKLGHGIYGIRGREFPQAAFAEAVTCSNWQANADLAIIEPEQAEARPE